MVESMNSISADDIRNYIKQGEGPHVEFKTRFTADNLIARHLSAFANSGGGIIIFGVGSHNEILGLSDEELTNTKDRLERLAKSLLPIYAYELDAVSIDGKPVVYLNIEEVNKADRPIRLATGDALTLRDGAVVQLGEAVRAVKPSRKVRAFVAMSFRTEEHAALVDYFEAMKRATNATGLPIDLIRIDLLEGDYEISQKIMDEIDKSEIVIADFTLNPANVYFELGYARSRKCQIIQTALQGTLLQFDTRNWRTLFYKNATELETRLGSALSNAYAEVVEAGAVK
jgi:predicted HTH transcriptional regulator